MADVGSFEELYKEVVDYLAPLQTVYEQALYHILFRWSYGENKGEVRLGQRTLAKMAPLPTKTGTLNKGSQIRRSSQHQVATVMKSLVGKGHIEIRDTTFDGTLYKVKLPRQIPECVARIAEVERDQGLRTTAGDFYTIPENRRIVFERDSYCCRYCGVTVTPDNATLDHIKPVSEGGDHSLRNLVTCCLSCNSIKAARKPNESSLDLLDRFKKVAKSADDRMRP